MRASESVIIVRMQVKTSDIVSFHRMLTNYYYESGRHDMPWRMPDKKSNFDPYKIMVSEIMLQQTQVDRVMPKYETFLKQFPSVHDLATASLGEVLKTWSGLGYNRRAKYIWQAARTVQDMFAGVFPRTAAELQELPGVGPNTAGAIMAYAYDEPVVYIETNIRTVVIHHFYPKSKAVADKSIRKIMEKLVPKIHDSEAMHMQGAILGPREFYWAMMDYGSYLKKSAGNAARASKHYKKQSEFRGSKRELRGKIIRLLTTKPRTVQELEKQVQDDRLPDILNDLAREDMIIVDKQKLRLS